MNFVPGLGLSQGVNDNSSLLTSPIYPSVRCHCTRILVPFRVQLKILVSITVYMVQPRSIDNNIQGVHYSKKLHNLGFYYCRPSSERTNRGSGWSDNADCLVLPNYVYIYIYKERESVKSRQKSNTVLYIYNTNATHNTGHNYN
jgi:hypothetical protein